MATPDITPPDYTTGIGQVRLLIPDVEQLANPADPLADSAYLFSDSQIQALLSMYSSNIKRAAGQAKLILATSEAMINKVIKTNDLSTDGAKLAAELRAQSTMLMAEADKDDTEDSYDSFTIVGNSEAWDNSWL